MDENLQVVKQSLLHIDATPTPDYAIRILKAYRQECDWQWSSTSDELALTEMTRRLNDLQVKRAEILDNAIKILESSL